MTKKVSWILDADIKGFFDHISHEKLMEVIESRIADPRMLRLLRKWLTASGTSNPYNVTVASTQPGLLAPPSFDVGGKQYVVAVYSDGVTYVLPPGVIGGVTSQRAKPGDSIILYGVGFGPVAPNIPGGQIVQQSNSLNDSLQITFSGTAVSLSYFGLAPGYIGLYQFNVVVPNVPTSDAVPVTFMLGGSTGSQTIYTAVQN